MFQSLINIKVKNHQSINHKKRTVMNASIINSNPRRKKSALFFSFTENKKNRFPKLEIQLTFFNI